VPGSERRWPAALDDAGAHLRASDPALRELIDSIDELGARGRRAVEAGDHYGALVRSIIGQQLSAKVARVMYERMLERFGGRPPTPAEVLAEEPEEFRAAIGLSRSKVSFLRSLAEHVTAGSLELVVHLPDAPEDVVGRILLLPARWVLHHLEFERLSILDRHLGELETLPVAHLVRAEDRHRHDRRTGLERQPADPCARLIGQLPGPRAASLRVHADRPAALEDLEGADERLLVVVAAADREDAAVAVDPLARAGFEQL